MYVCIYIYIYIYIYIQMCTHSKDVKVKTFHCLQQLVDIYNNI